MKAQFSLFILFLFILISCESTPNLKNDQAIQLDLPIFENEKNPFVLAVANDGKVWQWKHPEGNKIIDLQELPFENVHSAGLCWDTYGWALKNNGKVVVWDLNDPSEIIELGEEKLIKQVSGSNTHLAYIFLDGTVGFVPSPNAFLDPVAGMVNLKNVADLICGSNYTMACTEDGKVYVTGDNYYYLVLEDQEYFEEPYQIQGLSNIKKVGISNYDGLKYAVDNDNNLYYWGHLTAESGIYKVERKAKDLVSIDYLLQYDGSIALMRRYTPQYGIVDSTFFSVDTKFEEYLYYRDFNEKQSHLVIDLEGKVIYYNEELKGNNGNYYSVNVDPVEVEGLRLDLNYFQ